MSHFQLESDVNGLLKMTDPLDFKRPSSCRERMNGENSIVESINCSVNRSMNRSTSLKSTPFKASKTESFKTPNKSKQTPGKSKLTPMRGDRHIPNRSTSLIEQAMDLMQIEGNNRESEQVSSASQEQYEQMLREHGTGVEAQSRILSFRGRVPVNLEGASGSMQAIYSNNRSVSTKKQRRFIPDTPERILDAPEIVDDYYLNCLDWSSQNWMAVALGGFVYLWHATSGEIIQLMEMEQPEDYVSSLNFTQDGSYLAVGTSRAEVQIWDVNSKKRVRNMLGHAERIPSLAWNEFILSSGCRNGAIHQHDVRVARHQIAAMNGHTQEVCGLRWTRDGRTLASGGNDNLVLVWSWPQASSSPILTLNEHQAAVKALAWCPWQSSLLTSGGGTNDRTIRFWNCHSGTLLNTVDAQSQVSGLIWSEEYKELISAHGFAHNNLVIWKYPSMTKVADLKGHTNRLLHLALSPDGTTVVSAAADETLRLWKCFDVDPKKKKSSTEEESRSKGSRPQLASHTLLR